MARQLPLASNWAAPVNKGDVPRQSICFNGCLELRVHTRQVGWDITPGKSKNNVKTVATLRMNRTPQCRNQVRRPYAEYAYREDSCYRQRVHLTKLHLFNGIRFLWRKDSLFYWGRKQSDDTSLHGVGFAVTNSFLSTIEPHVCL